MPNNDTENPYDEALKIYLNWSEQQNELDIKNHAVIKPLYHYTNAEGLIGIIKSRSIWHTHYGFLNDPTELRHGIHLTHEKLADLKATTNHEQIRIFSDKVVERFQYGFWDKKIALFIASFSQDSDTLSQWIKYGDNARGFCIGFSHNVFSNVESDEKTVKNKSYIRKVSYDDYDSFDGNDRAIQKAIEAINSASHQYALKEQCQKNEDFLISLSTKMISYPLLWNCVSSKHKCYEDEQEVRQIIMVIGEDNKDRIKVRSRGGRLIPYIEQPLGTENCWIETITMGPATDKNDEASIKYLLDTFGLGGRVEIKKSNLPYR